MATHSLDLTSPAAVQARPLQLARPTGLGWLGLAVIVAGAASLRFANLDSLGYVNHYYTAGVTSMLQSWHNFFFVAAEPGGAVSIDKPPLGLWLQAISAYFLGVNGFAVLLPEILAGLASVAVLYHLVQRRFGIAAGWLAALAFALTPIVVATDRNNTMDSPLILTLLLAAWAFIKATESGRLRFLLLGALLVGLGFNIKMMQAYLPLPAFFALYFFGASASLRRKVVNLSLATVVLAGVSLAWAVAVDLTPAEQRPYVGSSDTNSVLELMLGYNGVQRLTGAGGGQPQRPAGTGQFAPPNTGPNGQLPPTNFGDGANGQRPQGPGGPAGRGGFPGTGQPGALRLFVAPLSKEMSWLLPFSLISAGLLLFGARRSWPLAAEHQSLVLWGGWLVIGGAFFSIAGFFHEYYLSMLAPPLAALVGLGALTLWQMRERRPWLALIALLLAATVTLAFQAATALSFLDAGGVLAIAGVIFIVSAALLVIATRWPVRRGAALGFAGVMLALLLIPGVWSVWTMQNSSSNQSLPAAYTGRVSGPSNSGDLQLNQTLLDYVTAHTQSTDYLMAVPSAMQGADYVIATGRPVLYLGGFNGQDKVATPEALAQMVADGELRFVYWSANGDGGGPRQNSNQTEVTEWVTGACTPVPGFDTATISAGAPDGAQGGLGNGGLPGGPGRQMQMTLYDCGG